MDEVMKVLENQTRHQSERDQMMEAAAAGLLSADQLQGLVRAQERADSMFANEDRLLQRPRVDPPVQTSDLEAFNIKTALVLLRNVEEADMVAFALRFKAFTEQLVN